MVLAAIAALAALAAAVVSIVVAPRRALNQLLALLLVCDGAVAVMLTFILQAVDLVGPGEVSTDLVVALLPYLNGFLLALPWIFLLFIGLALRTPLARPLRHPLGQTVVILLLLLSLADVTLNPAEPQIFEFEAFLYLIGLTSLYGLMCAITAYQLSPKRTRARRQASAYMVAFGARDAVWFVALSTMEILLLFRIGDPYYALLALPFATLAFVSLLIIGVLRSQLFDIDIQLRVTVKRGTIAMIFLAVGLLVASITETYLQQFNWLAGGVAAGVMLVALHPLQRFADRVANIAVPDARSHGSLTTEERLALYEEQLRIAWEDGNLSMKERRLLDAVRRRLGIEPGQAANLEASLLQPRRRRPSKARGTA